MRFVVMLACSAMSTWLVAEDRFYSTVDAQGRVQVIKGDVAAKKDAKQPIAPKETKLLPATPAIKNDASPAVVTEEGTHKVDDETYVDTEFLEKKNFNIHDKKRFYYLPDGGIGTRVVESLDGVVNNTAIVSTIVKPNSYVSSSYWLLEKSDVLQSYPQHSECVPPKLIKKNSKPFKNTNNIWVKPSFTANTLEMDGLLDLTLQMPNLKQLRVSSFATTQKKSTFYVPVVVFLDDKGCTLSGVWQYWSRAHPATEFQYASVDGLIDVPVRSAYVVFYRPSKILKADIPLSAESGSIVVEAY